MDQRPLAYSYIRLSTSPQTRGHGRQRQLEESRAYAEENGLHLVEDGEPLEDVISAFRGANIKQGALGRFLERAKKELIPKGSYLLVESLDRISREEVQKSFRVLLDILDAGINVATVQDKHVYKPNGPFEDYILLLTYLNRGHNKSSTTSFRLSKNWKAKRANARERPLTAICPAWLRLSGDRSHYEVDENRAAVIEKIFEYTVKGIGTHALEKILNDPTKPTKPFGGSEWWNRSYLLKILDNRAVLGEFQPCKMLNGEKSQMANPYRNIFLA